MRHLLTVALLALPALAVNVGGIELSPGPLDRVEVTRSDWVWRSGAEAMPAVTVTMRSGRFGYALRHDQKSGNGNLGLSEPSQANWYQAGMINLLVNGERLDLLPANAERIELASGERGRAVFAWEDERVKATYTFVLFAGQDRLPLRIELEPKVPIESLAVRLQAYVGGFNHQPRHWLWLPDQRVDQAGTVSFDPIEQSGLFLADAAQDPEDQPTHAGPCAVAFDPAGVTAATVRTGGYGVPVELTCDPAARRLALCFWEFPQTPNETALARFVTQLPAALAQLTDPATFE